MNTRAPLKKQTLDLLVSRGVPVGTILDVGVLNGTPELKQAFPRVRHILFEPVAEFTADIERAYRDIDHEIHTVAVSDAVGTVTLQMRTVFDGMKISHSGMTPGGPGDDPMRRVVPTVTLDAFVRDRDPAKPPLSKPYLLKIDIDGHEMKVIHGARDTLRDCSVVIVECPRRQFVERIAAIQEAGFELFDLSEPCYYDKAFWQCDAVFLRRDLHATLFEQLTGMVTPGMYEIFCNV